MPHKWPKSLVCSKRNPYLLMTQSWGFWTPKSVILWVAELQHKLNSQPHTILSVKVRAFIRKKWGPEHWNQNKWANLLVKLGTLTPELHWVFFARSRPSTLNWGEVCFAWRICNGLPEVVALPDTTDSPQDLHQFFASRPVTRLKSQQAPKSEVQIVTPLASGDALQSRNTA